MLVNNDGIAIVAEDLIERVHEGFAWCREHYFNVLRTFNLGCVSSGRMKEAWPLPPQTPKMENLEAIVNS